MPRRSIAKQINNPHEIASRNQRPYEREYNGQVHLSSLANPDYL